MKNILKVSLTMLFALTLTVGFAQTKNEAPAKENASPKAIDSQKPWAELQAFHEVMSKSFHPTEDGNFKPLKENSTLLLQKSQEWQKSVVPANFDSKKVAEVLNRLTVKCGQIDEAVKSGKDNDGLKVLITEAHEIFHELVEKCRKPEEDTKAHSDKK